MTALKTPTVSVTVQAEDELRKVTNNLHKDLSEAREACQSQLGLLSNVDDFRADYQVLNSRQLWAAVGGKAPRVAVIKSSMAALQDVRALALCLLTDFIGFTPDNVAGAAD